jgi:PAS domain S-box-containing protein
MFKSLKTRVILMVGLPILVVIFGLLFVSASQQQKAALLQAEDLSSATIREQSTELQALLDHALGATNLAAEVFRNVNDHDNPLDMGRESAALILKGMQGKEDNYSGVFTAWEADAFDMMDVAYEGLPGNSCQGRFSPYWFYQSQGDPVLEALSDEEINIKNGWYENFRLNPQPSLVWAPSSKLPSDSTRVLRVLSPIVNNGEFIGVVGIDIGAGVLETMVSAWANPQRETTVHLHTITGGLVAPAIVDATSHFGLSGDKTFNSGVFWKDETLVVSQGIDCSLAQSNLVVTMEMPRHILLGPMQKEMQRNLLGALGIIVCALLFVGYFIKTNLKRLVQLSRFARQVSLGEKFEQAIDESGDEIGQLNRDFQSMLVSLQDAEEERRESLTRLKAILDSVQAGVVIIDPDDRTIVDANPAALNMLGLPKEKVLKKICHGFMCPAETDSCPVLDLEQLVEGERKILLKSDGSELIIFKTVVSLELKGKTYLLETFVDVDQQVKAEQELSEKLAQISQAKKHQDILVSHAVSREERMVALKTEVNDLRLQLGISQRYKAPGEIETWRRELAEDEILEHHEI